MLQHNDPDPLLWILLYLYGALLCFLSIKKIYKPLLFVIGLGVYIAYAVILFFSNTGVLSWVNEHDAENIVQSMKAAKPWIEETREFFGLLLLITAVLINAIWFSRKKKIQT